MSGKLKGWKILTTKTKMRSLPRPGTLRAETGRCVTELRPSWGCRRLPNLRGSPIGWHTSETLQHDVGAIQLLSLDVGRLQRELRHGYRVFRRCESDAKSSFQCQSSLSEECPAA